MLTCKQCDNTGWRPKWDYTREPCNCEAGQAHIDQWYVESEIKRVKPGDWYGPLTEETDERYDFYGLQ